MKYLPLIGCLLVSASPAFAEDLVYLTCKGDLTSKVTNTNTSEVVQENKDKHIKTYIVDRERRKVMSKGEQWMNAEIIDGFLTGSGTVGQGFSTSEETIRMRLNPVGEYIYQQKIIQRNISMQVDVLGTCQEIDSSSLWSTNNSEISFSFAMNARDLLVDVSRSVVTLVKLFEDCRRNRLSGDCLWYEVQ